MSFWLFLILDLMWKVCACTFTVRLIVWGFLFHFFTSCFFPRVVFFSNNFFISKALPSTNPWRYSTRRTWHFQQGNRLGGGVGVTPALSCTREKISDRRFLLNSLIALPHFLSLHHFLVSRLLPLKRRWREARRTSTERIRRARRPPPTAASLTHQINWLRVVTIEKIAY